MFLNYEEIQRRNLIQDLTSKEFSNASYNLTVENIIDMDGKSHSVDYRLKPQGMVYVIFKERLNIPLDLIGFAHVKTTLTKQGVMATNIGIIDPGYDGLISTLLINFGKVDYLIEKGDPALRVSFSKIDQPINALKAKNWSEAQYVRNVKNDITHLDEKFLNLSAVRKDVIQEVISGLFKIGVVFTVLAFLVGLYFQKKNSSERDLERSIKQYETELLILQKENDLLRKENIESKVRLKKNDLLLNDLINKDSVLEASMNDLKKLITVKKH